MKDKLVRIYLQKEKENIRNFSLGSELNTLLFEKVIDVEKLEEQVTVSDEDVLKINQFTKMLLENCVMPLVIPRMKKWTVKDNT
jgi:hypothetical protein